MLNKGLLTIHSGNKVTREQIILDDSINTLMSFVSSSDDLNLKFALDVVLDKLNKKEIFNNEGTTHRKKFRMAG
jgi:hypothetical protein|tara:strand:- start:16 stop:237 length:222 start_codon:yes stop_codon:yes gene_type:complete